MYAMMQGRGEMRYVTRSSKRTDLMRTKKNTSQSEREIRSARWMRWNKQCRKRRYGTGAQCGMRGKRGRRGQQTKMGWENSFLKTVDEFQDMDSGKQEQGETGNVCMQHGKKNVVQMKQKL
jgi:hypothetical protein